MIKFPSLCIDYSHGCCINENCPSIHMCKRLVLRGQCKGAGCSLNHQLINKDVALIRAYGLTPYTPNWLHLLRQFHMTSQTFTSEEFWEKESSSLMLFKKALQTSGRRSAVTFLDETTTTNTSYKKISSSNFNSSTSSSMSSCSTQSSYLHSTNSSGAGLRSMNLSGFKSQLSNQLLNDTDLSDLSRAFSPLKLGEALDVPVLKQRPASPVPKGGRNRIEKPHDVEKNTFWQVCAKYVDSQCAMRNKCKLMHPKVKRSYNWIYKFDDETQWFCLDDKANDQLEIAFSDPGRCEYLNLKLPDIRGEKVLCNVTFLNYIFAESVCEPVRSAQMHRCGLSEGEDKRWVWYWLHNVSPAEWVPYGTQVNGVKSNIASVDIETIYRKMKDDTTEVIEFNVSGKKGYTLTILKSSVFDGYPYFQESIHGTVRRVCRRPKLTTGKNNTLVSQWPTICANHPTFPCTNDKCPMFGYKGNYLWVASKYGDARWSLLPVDTARGLEVQFVDPHITQTTLKWDKLDWPLTFTNRGMIVSTMPAVRVQRICYDSHLWTWYSKEAAANVGADCWVSKASVFPQIVSKLFEHQNQNIWKDNCKRRVTLTYTCSPYIASDWSTSLENCYRSGLKIEGFDSKLMVFKFKDGRVEMLCRRPAMEDEVRSELAKAQYNMIPQNWITKSGFSYQVLEPGMSEDYAVIANVVLYQLPKASFLNIYRIENHSLWKLYCVKRQDMLKKLGKSKLNEALMFHGTHPDNVDKIARNNFDFRRSGEVFGAVYGQGSYFTPEFEYALHLASTSAKGKGIAYICLMVGLVLCGESCVGHSSYRRPPPKNRKELYDSCVGDNREPSQVVIFDHNQVYPMFLICVSKSEKKSKKE